MEPSTTVKQKTKTSNSKIQAKTLNQFQPISLSQLNATARFLDRIDTKYILSFEQLQELLPTFADQFYILQIGEHRIFTYDNVYMDTDDLLFYYQHERWVKPRMKVRSRCYVESNLSFFEAFLKSSIKTAELPANLGINAILVTMAKWQKQHKDFFLECIKPFVTKIHQKFNQR